mgnify:CR=1 FL=1
MDGHTRMAIVPFCCKMSANWVFNVLLLYVVEMWAKSVYGSVLSLADILFVADSTVYAIDQIMAFAGNMFPGHVCSSCGGTRYVSTLIQKWAIIALLGVAFIQRVGGVVLGDPFCVFGRVAFGLY